LRRGATRQAESNWEGKSGVGDELMRWPFLTITPSGENPAEFFRDSGRIGLVLLNSPHP
jgi:hypothetical protein